MPRSDAPAAPAGLLLAAGAGRRFGRPKALVEWDGDLLVERGVELLRGAGCNPVVVVLGAEATQVMAAADLAEAHVVVNEEWASGQASSLRAGLAALDDAPAAVVALVDQPLVSVTAVERLIDAWRGGASAAVATYADAPRTPVLLDASIWAEVAEAAQGDTGARGWLRRHPERVTPVACGDVADPDDIDTPQDLDRLKETAAWT